MMRALLLSLLATVSINSLARESSCATTGALHIRVRFAEETPREVQIESMQPAGILLRDLQSRQEIWSAGPAPANTQQVAGMDSSFGASFTAVHLDADGVHDRIYAGDRAGRLWRFDLHSGARPAAWMEASMLADLRAAGGGRGFIAPPDVARIQTAAGESWFNVAIGTANTDAPRTDHRFYVLRDFLAGRATAPLLETDLESLSPPAGTTRGNARGYYLSLGSAQVLAQALTLDGQIHFTAVETSRNLIAACEPGTLRDTAVPLSVTVLRARDGELQSAAQQGDDTARPALRRRVADALPAATGVVLAASMRGTDGVIPCTIADEPLPGCLLDTRPRRTWWRREDAD